MLKTLPPNLTSLIYPILLGALMALRLFAAMRADLVPDESYYWLWAQHPALGYYDHPPMVAWFITASTAVFGDSTFAIRLPFILSFVALCWVVYDTAKTLFDDAIARRAVLWVNACLMLSIGTVIATPDPPSVLMWALGLWALAKLQTSEKGMWWLAFGVFAGLGFEAKYTNLFLGLGVIVWIVLDKNARRWLLTPWPYLGAIVAVAFMAPNLLWNAQHHYVTLAKQFGRLEAGHLTPQYLIEFVLSQPLLLNPLVFVFVVLGVKAWLKDRSDRALTLLVALPLPLLAYMLIHVFHDRIQGNWPAPIFPGLVILAAASAENITSKVLIWCRNITCILGITLSAIALIYLSYGAMGLGQGWNALSRQIEARQVQTNAGWVATVDYDTEGELSYHLELPVLAVAERERYNWDTTEAHLKDETALIVVPSDRHSDLKTCFGGLTDLGLASRLRTHGAKSDFHLYYGVLKQVGCAVK